MCVGKCRFKPAVISSSRQSALTNSASDGPAASTSRRVTVRLCLGARRVGVKRAESVAAQRRDGRYLLHLGLFEAHCWPPGPRASVIATVVHCPSVPVWRDHGAFDIAELAVARARLEHVEASARSSPQRAARTAVWRLIRRAARAALPGATTQWKPSQLKPTGSHACPYSGPLEAARLGSSAVPQEKASCATCG